MVEEIQGQERLSELQPSADARDAVTMYKASREIYNHPQRFSAQSENFIRERRQAAALQTLPRINTARSTEE
jgi:hypothetical protein